MHINTSGLNRLSLEIDNLNKDSSEIENRSFSNYFKDALNEVNELQMMGDEYKELLVTGDVDNLHDVTIAAEKANISLQLTLGIRNKIVEAYKEIMRMQI